VAPAGSTSPQADSRPPDFIGQLKTALKNLADAVTQPAPKAAQVPNDPNAGPTDPAVDSKLADSKAVDDTADLWPELLAVLGFVPVPIALLAPATPQEKTADTAAQGFGPGASTTAASDAAAAAAQLQSLLKSAQAGLSQPLPSSPNASNDALQAQAQLELSKLLKPEGQPVAEVQLPLPAVQSMPVQHQSAPRAQTQAVQPTVDAMALTVTTAPTAPPTPNNAAPLAAGPTATAPQAAPAAAPAVDLTVPVGSQPSAHQSGFQQGSADDQRQPTAKDSAAVTDSASIRSATAASDSALAAAAGSTASNGVTVVPTHIRPSEVVSQIAHQSDLYRLPGNGGVRIQLHPEDLGGVEVTLRYGVGGALQLHINVEHAATGSLVQAGWSELRDALATQGISPDRLVMSVSASNSSQLDFSSRGSDHQSDPSRASLTQGQSGQHRQDNAEQTGPRGWNGGVEPASLSDEGLRVASTTAPTSRIDYRA
jgi:flagellar hook-length control protein FliK